MVLLHTHTHTHTHTNDRNKTGQKGSSEEEGLARHTEVQPKLYTCVDTVVQDQYHNDDEALRMLYLRYCQGSECT